MKTSVLLSESANKQNYCEILCRQDSNTLFMLICNDREKVRKVDECSPKLSFFVKQLDGAVLPERE